MASADFLEAPPASAGGLLASFAESLGQRPAELPQAARAFVAQAQSDWAADELPGMTLADLGNTLAEFWRFGAAARDREPAIRLRRAPQEGAGQGSDLLEIVQPDRPFLVDSVMAAIADLRFPVRAMFHPVVPSEDGPRSMIQVFLEPVGEDRSPALLSAVREALHDVYLAVEDYHAMRALLRRTMDDLAVARLGVSEAARAEFLAFLNWLGEDRFVFLGAREYTYPRTADGSYAAEEPDFMTPHGPGGLGVLRDPERVVLHRDNEPAVLMGQVHSLLEIGDPVIVAKSNLRSRVHRRVHADYIGVRRYGPDGKPAGEVRLVGLFTAEAYEIPAREVPLIRRKLAHVLVEAGYQADSHNAKRLSHILETWPRDELFQIDTEELSDMARGVLHLYDRPRVRLFARRDPFDRFFSVLLFVPRDRYDTDMRERAGAILAAAYGGRIAAHYPSFSDAPLARIHYIVGVRTGQHHEPDLKALEQEIAEATRTWQDRFECLVRGTLPPGQVQAVITRTDGAFPPGYRDQYDAAEALIDAQVMDSLGPDEKVRVRAFRRDDDSRTMFRFKLYRPGEAAPLADVLPVLGNMGLKALIEDGFRTAPRAADGSVTPVWIHEFLLQDDRGAHLDFADIKLPFETAFVAIWNGRAESDGFNRLVLELGISWRQAALIRALARYRQQTGLDPTQAVQAAALADHAEVARLILDLFIAKFDPATGASPSERQERAVALQGEIVASLQKVESLDADRVLRRLADLVSAMTRTNYFQTSPNGQPKPYISFKIASREISALPLPRPYREIFVSAPQVEGIHLRFGPVARGGLRWSDRRDDFRTEVLGLVKAQQVKNAVIVPVGSKGGFYPKNLPRGGDAAAVRAEAVRAYTTFLRGLLDITDTIDAENNVVPPPQAVVLDDPDPYLVVAADKGTASFSDIANGVAESYGFWLGDAFASGGSVGYDHKAMAITARGAWEAVKRHFRELGKNIQTEPFTVTGVGDMSGDVFGNGMLLSQQILLRAAFDHRHIFLDPDPDPAISWAERKRLFDLPRSSWADYDRSRISAGGGVYARSAKTIALSERARAMLEITAANVTPDELMHAILKTPTELLYFGGIGCYVKAEHETNADAGDKANDAIRVDATELRAKVIGEGANLGLTQAGRIDFALAGGRLNTDAIDNSAGVDCSDHEVNIKILLGQAERASLLTREARNALLAEMTDDVARLVLRHNAAQTLALTLMDRDGVRELPARARFMEDLEAKGRLDRCVEGLPDAPAIAAREKAGIGLTRPELAVLLAYGKLDLNDDIVASDAPDDAFFRGTLRAYFPPQLATFAPQMERHRLRREIIATVLANDVVNLCGPTFPSRLRAAAACDTTALIHGFAAARAILGIDALWADIDALNDKAPADGQTALYKAVVYALRSLTFWLARVAFREKTPVQHLIDAHAPAVAALKELMPGLLSSFEQTETERRAQVFVAAGAPLALARAVAILQPLTTVTHLVALAQATSWQTVSVARLYHQVGAAFAFDRLRFAAGSFIGGDTFERLAVRRLIEDMLGEQTEITRAVLRFAANEQAGESDEAAQAAIASWSALRNNRVRTAQTTIETIERAAGGWSFAKLTIANAALRELTQEK
ncbi:MAG TPA: NAD-glutamate dehydrogenase [Acetobacteraceae bacterium]|nr:NAD-glutamate dehydrogenase [Acetobacteraceae bacterium]